MSASVALTDDDLDAMLMEIEEVDDDGDDEYGEFGELSEEGEQETPAFLLFMAPLMQIVEKLCSSSEPHIHYTYVCVNQEVRGQQRLMYVMNTLGDACLSDTYLMHQLFLIGSQCQLSREEWQGYVRRLNPQVAYEFSHAPVINQEQLQTRVSLLDVVTAYLSTLNERVTFAYPREIEDYAAENEIELVREGDIEVMPFIFFYEGNVKINSVAECIKGSAGWGHHADFPALRLIRLMLRHDGPTEMARDALKDEIGDEAAAAQDPMYGLLSLLQVE